MPKHPNILFVMADQMAPAFLPIHGHRLVKAPNIEALADRGTVFDSAYCASPLCAPSRFSMMAGRRPAGIGAFDNAADFAADIPTFAHYLRQAGYRTALSPLRGARGKKEDPRPRSGRGRGPIATAMGRVRGFTSAALHSPDRRSAPAPPPPRGVRRGSRSPAACRGRPDRCGHRPARCCARWHGRSRRW